MEEEERRSDLQSFQETAEQQSSSNLKVAVNLNDQFQQQRDMKKRQRLHQFNIVPESSLGEKGMDNSELCVCSREVDVVVDVDSRADTT
jgi:hypothetical protein